MADIKKYLKFRGMLFDVENMFIRETDVAFEITTRMSGQCFLKSELTTEELDGMSNFINTELVLKSIP